MLDGQDLFKQDLYFYEAAVWSNGNIERGLIVLPKELEKLSGGENVKFVGLQTGLIVNRLPAGISVGKKISPQEVMIQIESRRQEGYRQVDLMLTEIKRAMNLY
jgi:hypothetical protein